MRSHPTGEMGSWREISGSFRSRQLDPKAAASQSVGFDTDRSTHSFDGFSDDGQADASAFKSLFGVNAFEHAK